MELARKKNVAAIKKKRLEEKREDRRKKKEFYDQDIKTRREKAVTAFNAYIRRRDRGRNCISCNKPSSSGSFDAGHYIPAGNCSALRFSEFNVSLQCHWNCNIQQSGNRTEYRKGLIERYGEEIVNFLEGPQPLVKATAQWYKEIEVTYKEKLKELEEKFTDMAEEF